MANLVLLPGFGGAYTSEVFSAISTNSLGLDTLDCTRCAWLSIQLNSTFSAGAGYQLQQSFNMMVTGSATTAAWSNLGPIIQSMQVFSFGAGPFGVLRFGAVSVSSGSSSATVVGFKLQSNTD